MSFLQLALPSRFRIVRRIGEGGMGVVYEALDVERGERIALKTILRHDADTVARVKHEFRALQDIHHPNLVTLRELVAEDEDVFFTMDLVDGVDLLTWIRGPRRKMESDAPTAADARGGHSHSTSGSRTRATLGGTEADRNATTDRDMAPPLMSVAPGPAETSARSRDNGTYDETRLRDAFRQVALGLSALHGAGKIHRDVKPSNVRVTPEGRVVLLDFGLVFELDSDQFPDTQAVGTPAYMAPEQASTKGVGPEADWYALGVMLYEALTGRRPFEGPAASVLWAKHTQEVMPPRVFVPEVPPDLEGLCLELLRADPATRPPGEEVMKRLQALSSDRPSAGSAPFVGRDGELRQLEQALLDVRAGRAVTVILHGESGVGKSCLVRRFVDTTLANRNDVLLLSGRCYEREAVPYKALDEVIELLSRRLSRLPLEQARALLPPSADALARIFPAMARIPALDNRPSLPDLDPLERRRAAFRALRELLRGLTREQRVVVSIDDLQWTDADSLALLQELLRVPDAPPMLLLATMRSPPNEPNATPGLVSSLPGEVRTIPVGRLAREDARHLAEALLAQAAGGGPASAVDIAMEAEGHPLFIDELVRHAAISRSAEAGVLRLDDALWRRVQRLDEASRRVLEVACVLGVPVSQEVVAHAAGVEPGELARAVSLLRATNFVRTGGARVADAMEPFHDRVREALVARLGDGERRSCHQRIADALERAPSADPELLATQWAGAGQIVKAAKYTVKAAEQAAQALAFKRAAVLFQRGLDQMAADDPHRREVRERLGDALANAGECARAAEAYDAAAAGAPPPQALYLHRRAADQLLRAGEASRGLSAARKVLAEIGILVPTTRLGLILLLVWLRLLMFFRGTRYKPRATTEVVPKLLTQIDVCWSVSFTLPYADPLVSAICQAWHVLLALRSGVEAHIARALAVESGYVSSVGFKAWPKAVAMLAKAGEIAERSASPHAQAMVSGMHGIAACVSMQFREAIEALKRAADAFRAQVPGSSFEVTTSCFYMFTAMAYCGRYAELRPLLEEALVDAAERGDTYSAVMLRIGILNTAWLFGGDVDRARREIAEARGMMVNDVFRVMDYEMLVAESYLDIYDGQFERAYARFHAARRQVVRTGILYLEAYRVECHAMHARLALGCAARAKGQRREVLVREAESLLHDLRGMPGGIGRANRRIIQACSALLRGRREDALALVQQMADEPDPDAWTSIQCARLLLGRLRGDAVLQQAAEKEVQGRGGVACSGLLRTAFPAFDAEL